MSVALPRPRTVGPTPAYVVTGVALTTIYFLFRSGGTAQSVIYALIGFSSAAAVEAGIALNRPARRLPWDLFAVGLALFSVGDVLFDIYQPEGASLADVFYLAGYPPLAAGLVLLIRTLRGRERQAALVEASIVTIAFALAQWVFVMRPLIDEGGGATTLAVDLAYPAMDVVLLATLAGFLANSAWRTEAFGFLVASVALLLVADELFLGGSYDNGSWVDSLWLLSYVFWGAAALHPSMRVLTAPPPGARLRVGSPRLALLSGALLAAPVVLLVQRIRDEPLNVYAVVVAAAALALLVLARLVGILRSLEAIRLRERAARADAVDAHRELAAQNERLLEADRLKDEFVAMISHDLRTPLTSIMGYVELALDPESGELSDEQRGYLEVVARNSERLLALVNDLLFAARVQSGTLDLEPVRLDLAAVARQSVDEARPRAEAKGIELAVDVQPVPELDADRGRIFQLLDNLVSNAIKFTPSGGSVRVRVAPRDDAVRLEVADTGIGIPAAEVERLFERFFRASTAVARQVPGTGLGLYIARAIVDAHGGRIDVTSDEGRGTTFCIELPVAR